MIALSDGEHLPSSLYCDLFYSNPGASEFRKDYFSVWTRIRLARGAPSSEDTLLAEFHHGHPGCTLDDATARAVILDLEGAGLVKRDGGKVVPAGVVHNEVTAAAARYDASREAFLNCVVREVEKFAAEPLATDERRAVQGASEGLVVHALASERASLEALYGARDPAGVLRLDHPERRQFLVELLGKLQPATLRTRRWELSSGILAGLSAALAQGMSYAHTLHRSVIGSFFLIQNPHHVDRLRRMAESRQYYLDTNVYLAWFYPSQSPHALVEPLLELLRKHDVRLRVLPETVVEIEQIEQQARAAVRRAEGDPTLAEYLRRDRKAIFSDYWHMKARDRNLRFEEYGRLFMGPRRILATKGVLVEDVTFEDGEDFETWIPTFRNAIRGQKLDAGRVVREEALDHDARVLVKLAKLQLRGSRDEWGSTARFLSLDSSLNRAISEVRNVIAKQLEFVEHPATVARLVIPLAAAEVERDQYEGYVQGAILQALGLVSEMRGYGDLDIIARLDQAGLPIRAMLALPNDLLQTALGEMQGRRGLASKLERALTATQAADRDAAVDEIKHDLEEALAFGGELQRETEQRLADESVNRKKLEERLSQLEQDTQGLRREVTDRQAALQQALQAAADLRATGRRWRIVAWISVALVLIGLVSVISLALVVSR